MSGVDRVVRTAALDLLIDGEGDATPDQIAARTGLQTEEVAASLHRLAAEHRLVLTPSGESVWMAHPFSGVPTDYQARIGEKQWWANCAWDAFAILALFGDGEVVAALPDGQEAHWTVEDDEVTPDGLVHFVVPPRRFWDDIGFT